MKQVSCARGWRAPSPAVRPLIAWSAPQLDAIAVALQARCLAWATAWGLQWPRQELPACVRARDPGEAPWLRLVHEHGIGAWSWQPTDFTGWIASSLVGVESPNTPVATAIVGACVEDLRRGLAGAGGWSPCPVPQHSSAAPAVFVRWSEGVLAVLPRGLRLLFDAAAVKAVLLECGAALNSHARGAPVALVSVASAMADAPMRLRVQLQGCELDLGSLRGLQVGDVLRLRHRIEEPASVRTAGGDALFNGFLVRSRGRKAVELAPAA